MQRLDQVTLTQTPRMADFTRWGCAVTEALHHSQEDFLQAYQANIANQHDEALEASPIGTALMVFMENRDVWEGSPSALLDALQPIAEDLKVEHHRSFPKNATWVWRRLKEMKVNLQEKGIGCEQAREGRGGDRVIRLSRNKDARDAVSAAGRGCAICRCVRGVSPAAQGEIHALSKS